MDQSDVLSFWNIIAGVSVPIVVQIGVMIWWMSKTNTKVDTLTTTMQDHIEEDDKVQERIKERLQALEVNEANVAGEIVNLGSKIDSIHRELSNRHVDDGKLLQLKLDKQSNELVLKFQDILEKTRRAWSDEMSRLAQSMFRGRHQ